MVKNTPGVSPGNLFPLFLHILPQSCKVNRRSLRKGEGMDARKAALSLVSVIGHLVVLAVSLGLLAIGIHLAFSGHWFVGPTIAFSGLVGCRVTGKAASRWARGPREDGSS